jgi:ubiquitin carboxyl-terminal hydrolase 36/42
MSRALPNSLGGHVLQMPPRHQHLFPKEDVDALLKWKEVRKLGAGLFNLGETCYINVILQCLTYTPPLAQYLLMRAASARHRHTGFCIYNLLEDHVNGALTPGTESTIAPTALVRNLHLIHRSFKLGRQEDAHEYLLQVLSSMHQRSLQVTGTPDASPDHLSETTLPHCIFGGFLRSTLTCPSCAHSSVRHDPFLDLSLSLGPGIESVQKALRVFTSPETLTANNCWACSACNKRVRASKRLELHRDFLPTVLALHSKRATFDTSGGTPKLTRHVAFSTTLDVQPFTCHDSSADESANGGEILYDLYSVVVHNGPGAGAGHFVSFVQNSNGAWHRMDDTSTEQVRCCILQNNYVCCVCFLC